MKKNCFVILFILNIIPVSAQTKELKKNYLNREDICCYLGAEIIMWNVDFNLKTKTYKLKIVHDDHCYKLTTEIFRFNGIYKINADTINLIDFKNNIDIKYLIKNDTLKVLSAPEKYKDVVYKNNILVHYYYKYKLDLISDEKYSKSNILKSKK
jgi:hypothetical protein